MWQLGSVANFWCNNTYPNIFDNHHFRLAEDMPLPGISTMDKHMGSFRTDARPDTTPRQNARLDLTEGSKKAKGVKGEPSAPGNQTQTNRVRDDYPSH